MLCADCSGIHIGSTSRSWPEFKLKTNKRHQYGGKGLSSKRKKKNFYHILCVCRIELSASECVLHFILKWIFCFLFAQRLYDISLTLFFLMLSFLVFTNIQNWFVMTYFTSKCDVSFLFCIMNLFFCHTFLPDLIKLGVNWFRLSWSSFYCFRLEFGDPLSDECDSDPNLPITRSLRKPTQGRYCPSWL